MLWGAHQILRTSFIMCTFAAAKVRIALARWLTIPWERAIYLQFRRSDEVLFECIWKPEKSEMTLKKKEYIHIII